MRLISSRGDPIEFAMMASKARLFNDHTTFAQIMTSSSPREHKKLGRQVKPFDGKVWDRECFNIVVKANMAKFSQHPEYKRRLLATGDKIIAEVTNTQIQQISHSPLRDGVLIYFSVFVVYVLFRPLHWIQSGVWVWL